MPEGYEDERSATEDEQLGSEQKTTSEQSVSFKPEEAFAISLKNHCILGSVNGGIKFPA